MPVPPYEPQPELATQRVPGGRRAALVVVVVALVIVGTFVWKPWDSGAPVSTSPAPSQRPIAAVATNNVLPTETPIPDDTPTFPVDGLGSIAIRTDDGPQVVCHYETVGKGRKARQVLSQLTAAPPLVTLGSAALNVGLKKMDLYVAVEVNRLATIFSAEWQPLGSHDGPSQSVRVFSSAPVFQPIEATLAFVPEANDEVYRLSLRVDWLNAAGDKLETQYFTLNSYGTAATTDDKFIPDGCPATIANDA